MSCLRVFWMYLVLGSMCGCASVKYYVPRTKPSEPKETVVLKVGERMKILKDRQGFYMDTISAGLRVDNPEIAKVDFSLRGRTTCFYLTGIALGKTGAYYTSQTGPALNCMFQENREDQASKRREPSFWVEVIGE